MITNQILQSTIDGLSGITKAELSVIDPDGKILATNFKESVSFANVAKTFAGSPADSQEIQNCQFFKIFLSNRVLLSLIMRTRNKPLVALRRRFQAS